MAFRLQNRNYIRSRYVFQLPRRKKSSYQAGVHAVDLSTGPLLLYFINDGPLSIYHTHARPFRTNGTRCYTRQFRNVNIEGCVSEQSGHSVCQSPLQLYHPVSSR